MDIILFISVLLKSNYWLILCTVYCISCFCQCTCTFLRTEYCNMLLVNAINPVHWISHRYYPALKTLEQLEHTYLPRIKRYCQCLAETVLITHQ